ncbi:20632_t:CDS:2, partial [Funneliformis geosporum]
AAAKLVRQVVWATGTKASLFPKAITAAAPPSSWAPVAGLTTPAVKLAAVMPPVPASVKLNHASMMVLSPAVAPVPSKTFFRGPGSAAAAKLVRQVLRAVTRNLAVIMLAIPQYSTPSITTKTSRLPLTPT